MPDFKYRLTTTIELLASCLAELAKLDQAEIVMTDWGSTPPLADSLQLSREACAISRFVYVPSEVIRDTHENLDFYHTARAANVGIRRSKGKFAFITNCDQLFSLPAVEQLFRLLSGEVPLGMDAENAFLVVPRIQIPWQLVQRQPSPSEWADLLLHNEYALSHEPTVYRHCFGVSAGFIMRSDALKRLRGLDERQSGWGWNDIDLGLRATQTHRFLWLSSLGIYMFHMGHPPVGRRHVAVKNPNTPRFSSSPEVNGSDWGLAQYHLHESRPTFRQKNARITAEQDAERRAAYLVGNVADALNALEQGEEEHGIGTAISEFKKQGRYVPAEDRLFFLLLHSISRRVLPINYLEFGFSKGYYASLATRSMPFTSIFAVEHLEGENKENPLVILLHFLDKSGFTGKFQFINAPIDVALDRVDIMYGKAIRFEIIVISDQSALLGAGHVERIFSLLDLGGTMLIRGFLQPDSLVSRNLATSGSEAARIISFDDTGCTLVVKSAAKASGADSALRDRYVVHERWYKTFAPAEEVRRVATTDAGMTTDEHPATTKPGLVGRQLGRLRSIWQRHSD